MSVGDDNYHVFAVSATVVGSISSRKIKYLIFLFLRSGDVARLLSLPINGIRRIRACYGRTRRKVGDWTCLNENEVS